MNAKTVKILKIIGYAIIFIGMFVIAGFVCYISNNFESTACETKSTVQAKIVNIEKVTNVNQYRVSVVCCGVAEEGICLLDNGNRYRISVKIKRKVRGEIFNDKLGFFECDKNGVITKVPRGYSKKFPIGKVIITGLKDFFMSKNNEHVS